MNCTALLVVRRPSTVRHLTAIVLLTQAPSHVSRHWFSSHHSLLLLPFPDEPSLTCCDARNASIFAISPASARLDVVMTQMLRQSCCWGTIAPWPWTSTGELPYAFASRSAQVPSSMLISHPVNLQLSNWRLCEAAATCQRLKDWRPHLQLWCGAVGAGDWAQPRARAVGRPARVRPLPGGRHRAVLGVHCHRGGGAADGGTSVPASGGDAGGLLISPINKDLYTGSISWPESAGELQRVPKALWETLNPNHRAERNSYRSRSGLCGLC